MRPVSFRMGKYLANFFEGAKTEQEGAYTRIFQFIYLKYFFNDKNFQQIEANRIFSLKINFINMDVSSLFYRD